MTPYGITMQQQIKLLMFCDVVSDYYEGGKKNHAYS